MLRWRLISAAVLISGLLLLLWLDYRRQPFGVPGLWLLPLALAGIALGVKELLALLAARGRPPHAAETYVGTLLVVLGAAAPVLGWPGATLVARGGELSGPLLALAAGIVLLFVGEMARYREPGGVTERIAAGVLILAYLGVLGSFLVLLRLWRDNAWGLVAARLDDPGRKAVGCGRLLRRPDVR